VLHFDVTFNSKADRWAYPVLKFEKPRDMSGFDGVAFDLNVLHGDPASAIRLMLVEGNGSHYMATTPGAGAKRRVVFLFRDMAWLQMMGSDPNGHFDPDVVSAVKIGCNVPSSAPGPFGFEVSGFELVRFRKHEGRDS
jgi:hypothetical protein